MKPKELEKKIAELEKQLTELKHLYKLSAAAEQHAQMPFENVQIKSAGTTKKIKAVKTPKPEAPNLGFSIDSLKEQLKAELREELKAELKAEYAGKIQAAREEGLKEGKKMVKALRESARAQGLTRLRAAPIKRGGRAPVPKRLTGKRRQDYLNKLFSEGKITARQFETGRIPSKHLPKKYKRGSDKFKILKEKFTEEQKAEAASYHHEKAKQAGKTYKNIPKGHYNLTVALMVEQEVKEIFKQRGLDYSKVKKGTYTKSALQQIAKFKSWLINPASEQHRRGTTWAKVVNGQIPLWSKELEKELRETRDVVGDYYGVNTP